MLRSTKTIINKIVRQYLISHISYLALTFSQSLTLISCISYLGEEFEGGGLSSPPPRLAKLCFKLLCHTYYTILYYTILTILTYYTYYTYNTYLLIGFIPYSRLQTRMLSSGAPSSYRILPGVMWRFLKLSGVSWNHMVLSELFGVICSYLPRYHRPKCQQANY
jgi:hypothetical protein